MGEGGDITKGHHTGEGDNDYENYNPPLPASVAAIASSNMEPEIPFGFEGKEAVFAQGLSPRPLGIILLITPPPPPPPLLHRPLNPNKVGGVSVRPRNPQSGPFCSYNFPIVIIVGLFFLPLKPHFYIYVYIFLYPQNITLPCLLISHWTASPFHDDNFLYPKSPFISISISPQNII